MKEVIERKKGGREALWMVPVGFVISFVYSVVVLWITPGRYESSTIVEFRKPPGAVAGEGWNVANEVALISSPKLLAQVASDLDLPRKWDMDVSTVDMILSEMTKVEAVEESDFQKITVTHSKAQTAKDIAERIPQTYSRFKAAQQREELNLIQRSLDDRIMGRQDLLDESGKVLRRLLEDVGLNLSGGDQLERATLVDYYQNHPEKKNATFLEKYHLIWQEYSPHQDALKVLQDQKMKTILEEAEPYAPIKVHGEARVPRVVSYPFYKAELWWALLKGLIFGLILGALTLLFFRVKRRGEDESDEPLKREAEPGDVW